MSRPHHSRTARHRLVPLLRDAGIAHDDFRARCGLPGGTVDALLADERLLVDAESAEQAWRAFPFFDLPEIFAHDLEDPASTAAQMLGLDGPLAVTVCGGGNLGHVFAGLLSHRADVDLRWLVSSARAAVLRAAGTERDGLTVERAEGDVTAVPSLITDDPATAVAGSHVILLCVPSFLEVELLDRVLPHAADGCCIGAAPAPGGFDWKGRDALRRHGRAATLFGLAAIPWMCKIAEPGRRVHILGGKALNAVVTLPGEQGGPVSDMLGHLLQMPVLQLRSFLNMTLNPGNQLLHPGIMYDLFHGREEIPVAEPPLFYESITPSAADRLQAMSDEVQGLRAALEERIEGLRLSAVLPIGLSILQTYGRHIGDASSLQAVIRTNRAYAGLRTPMVETDGGYLPDWSSRFFGEDIPHGLVVLRGLADLAGVAMPEVDRVLLWAQQRMGAEYLVDGALTGADMATSGAPQRYGIGDIDALPEAA